MSETVVIFRKDRTGWKDCFALFPELPADEFGNLCTAYAHLVQHAAADYNLCIAQSNPATAADYHDLYEELERRGYNLTIHSRATPEMHERRRRIAAARQVAMSEKQPRKRGGGAVLCERSRK
jgi:hypothetical protein